MIIRVLSIVLFLTFSTLGCFHFYWLLGGKWGLKSVIPSKSNKSEMLSIPKFATLIVGLVLVFFGMIYLVKSEFIAFQISNELLYNVYWFIPCVFILRAVGEFKYVGFFKKIKDTQFAKADSKLFSPLCLGIGLIGLLIFFN